MCWPQPEAFGDFPALISRTVSDLSTEERHVLRSVILLDAFSVPLATQVAGLSHDAAALRLSERPFVLENPSGLWPFHLHQVVRSAIRHAPDHTDDRWSDQDWQRAAGRALAALAALGHEWAHGPRLDRPTLIGCWRQGLRLARDFDLDLDLDWLTEAAFSYVGDSVWAPLAPLGTSRDPGPVVDAGRRARRTAQHPGTPSARTPRPHRGTAHRRHQRRAAARRAAGDGPVLPGQSPARQTAAPKNHAAATSRSPTAAAASPPPPAAA
ncbi:hypothetical protein ACFYO9_11060 [Streptomyces sp. NPDC005863]|uniref:hypothetical protein n=1 Tax=unclassified Streptomyces TaxID=2593676 RepID=UPI0033EECDBD